MTLRRAFSFGAGLLFALGSALAAAATSLSPLETADRDARAALSLIHAAVSAPDPARPSLGATLSVYAKNTGAEPARHEGFEAASRRILAGGPPVQIAPDAASARLAMFADSIAESLRLAEAGRIDLRPDHFTETVTALRVVSALARFHSRRILAAVHYNLFLRGQRLAELYAATMEAKAALDAWRDLATTAGDRTTLTFGRPPLTLSGPWRDELQRLEFDFKDLEAQCCPPDESTIREKVWTPLPAAPSP